MRVPYAARGEIWDVRFGATLGHEQAGDRPAVIVSVDAFNRGPRELVVVLPLTTTERERAIPLEVRVEPPEGGLEHVSYVRCEQPRTLSTLRLRAPRGRLSGATMRLVEERLRNLFGL